MPTKAKKVRKDEFKNPIRPLWVSNCMFVIASAVGLVTLYYMHLSY